MPSRKVNAHIHGDSLFKELLLNDPPLKVLADLAGIRYPLGSKTLRQVCRETNLHETVLLSVVQAVSSESGPIRLSLPAYGLLQLCDWSASYSLHLHQRIHEWLNASPMKEDPHRTMAQRTFVQATESHFQELTETLLPHIRKTYELYYSPEYTLGKANLLSYSMDFFPTHALPLQQTEDLSVECERKEGWPGLLAFQELVCEMKALYSLEERLLRPLTLKMEEDIVKTFHKRKGRAGRLGFIPMPEDETQDQTLSSRETDVLKLLALGFRNKEIAHRLSISLTTVITHRKHIAEKLDIHSVAGLTVYAYLNGLLEHEILINED